MSDSLFHFVFPIVAALAARVHLKHPVRNIVLAGLLSVLIDLDHLSFLGLSRALFHNVFVTILLPLVIVFLTFYFRKSYNTKGFAILLLIFLSSHTYLDWAFGGGVALFYPISQTYYSLNLNFAVSEGNLISGPGLGLLFYFVSIILPLFFLDEIIELMERKHESFRKALKNLIKF